MSFAWDLLDAAGQVTGRSPGFDTREAAEAWMGDEWRRLLDAGALAARLLDGSDELYTMKLTED